MARLRRQKRSSIRGRYTTLGALLARTGRRGAAPGQVDEDMARGLRETIVETIDGSIIAWWREAAGMGLGTNPEEDGLEGREVDMQMDEGRRNGRDLEGIVVSLRMHEAAL